MRKILLVISLIFSIVVHAQQQVTINCPECGHAIKVSISAEGKATAVHNNKNMVVSNNQCKATTNKGTQCSRKAQDGSDYCRQHASKARNKETTTTSTPTKAMSSASGGRCRATTKSGSRCRRTARSNGLCWQHGG